MLLVQCFSVKFFRRKNFKLGLNITELIFSLCPNCGNTATCSAPCSPFTTDTHPKIVIKAHNIIATFIRKLIPFISIPLYIKNDQPNPLGSLFIKKSTGISMVSNESRQNSFKFINSSLKQVINENDKSCNYIQYQENVLFQLVCYFLYLPV